MRRVVVVGASLAGVHAVESLRELGFAGEVVLVGAEPHSPYDRPPLSKEALREGGAVRPLRPDEWYAERGVQLRLGMPAVGLDPGRRTLTLLGGEELAYDGLVVATGSAARTLPLASGGPVHLLRTVDDCRALRAELVPGRRLVIVGGGPIGLEVAATATVLGLAVTLVELAPAPMARVFGGTVGRWLAEHHRARGVDVRCGVGVEAVTAGRGGSRIVRLTDGGLLTADVLVAGVGAAPAVDWLQGSGLSLGDGVVCDGYLRTSAPGVVAAGDVARWYNPLFDQQLRVEHWTNAIEQGRCAAGSLLGVADGPLASTPYFWSDQFDAKLRFVGTAHAAEEVYVERSDDTGLVVLFGRDGVLRGALCVNAPRQLARYRSAVDARTPWGDVATSVDAAPTSDPAPAATRLTAR